MKHNQPKPKVTPKMITKYNFKGSVRGSNKRVSSYGSIPMGLPVDEFNQRVKAFFAAFDNVTIEVKGN